MTKRTKAQEAERTEAIGRLHEILKPGAEVFTILRHCSKSGMQREISLFTLDKRDGYLTCLDYWASRALGDRIGKHGGIVVPGCGMDLGFHLVYNLGRTLWPKGTPKPHGRRNGQADSDGGYALKHRWM